MCNVIGIDSKKENKWRSIQTQTNCLTKFVTIFGLKSISKRIEWRAIWMYFCIICCLFDAYVSNTYAKWTLIDTYCFCTNEFDSLFFFAMFICSFAFSYVWRYWFFRQRWWFLHTNLFAIYVFSTMKFGIFSFTRGSNKTIKR